MCVLMFVLVLVFVFASRDFGKELYYVAVNALRMHIIITF